MDCTKLFCLATLLSLSDLAAQPVTEVEIKGAFRVYVSIGPYGFSKTGAPDDPVRIERSGHMVKVYDARSVVTSLKTTVYLSVPELRRLRMVGQCVINSEGKVKAGKLVIDMLGACEGNLEVQADTLEAKLSGENTLKLSGACAFHRVSLSGGGTYESFNLKSGIVHAYAGGSGMIEVYADSALFADATGRGMIFYKGNPSSVKAKHQRFIKHRN